MTVGTLTPVASFVTSMTASGMTPCWASVTTPVSSAIRLWPRAKLGAADKSAITNNARRKPKLMLEEDERSILTPLQPKQLSAPKGRASSPVGLDLRYAVRILFY